MLTIYHHLVLLSRNLGTLTSWNPLGPSGPVTGRRFFFLLEMERENLVSISYGKSYLSFVLNEIQILNYVKIIAGIAIPNDRPQHNNTTTLCRITKEHTRT